MAATSLETAIAALATCENGITGVVSVHETTPEGMAVFPTFINYPLTGELDYSPGVSHELHTIVAELHAGRGDLKNAEDLARPFINLFANAIWADVTLGGTVDTVNHIHYRYGRFQFQREEHVGIRFEVDIKLRRTL